MALPTIDVPVEQIKFRFGEKYISEAANRKFLGVPYGTYSGFVPSVDGNVVSLSPDPVSGFSFLRVLSGLDAQAPVDIYTTSTLTFDLTDYTEAFDLAVPGAISPIFIFATADYKLGVASSAKIEFRNTPVTSDTEQLLGQVFYDGVDLSVSATLPLERSNPFAYTDAPLGYGFMEDGQAEGLLDGLDTADEVIAARTDLAGTTWSALNDRLIEDFGASAMATRLAKSVRVTQSNVHTLVAPATSMNVSESFSEVTRQFAPALSILGGGDETQVGAITGPLDSTRNVVFVVNDGTKERPIDTDTDRLPIFGRLDYEETLLVGSYTCTSGSPGVAGVGTFFQAEVEIGDLVQGADGLYYPVASITDDLNLTLLVNFGGATGPVSNGVRRRFTLNFRKVDNVTEVDAALPAGDIRFFFGAFFGMDTPVLDTSLVMHQGGEPVRIGIATSAVSGRVLVDPLTEAEPVPLAGSIQTVKDSGFDVSRSVYDVDFDGAQLGGSPGVVDVTQRGPTGPTGPDGVGAPGPAGPQGPAGVGFNGGSQHASIAGNNHMWVKRGIVDHNALGQNVSYFHTVNTSGFSIDEILWATAGIWYIEDWGGASRDQGESWRLTQVTRDTATQVTLSAATETDGFLAVDIGIALNIAGRKN